MIHGSVACHHVHVYNYYWNTEDGLCHEISPICFANISLILSVIHQINKVML